MPKPLHLLSKRRKQQLINDEIARHQHSSPTLLFESNMKNIDSSNVSVCDLDLYGPNNSECKSNSEYHSKIIENELKYIHGTNDINLYNNYEMKKGCSIFEESCNFSDNFLKELDTHNTQVTDNKTKELLKDLREWILQFNIDRAAANANLAIWRKQGFDIPIDCRTIMKTPRITNKLISTMGSGIYSHFGIALGIKSKMKQIFCTFHEKILINVHIDGLPLTNSSKSDFWPILASICVNSLNHTEPFVIGIHHGKNKPENSNDFLRPFVDEMKNLEQNGIRISDAQVISIIINAILCDTPARSYVCKIKGHTGYEGCSKCI